MNPPNFFDRFSDRVEVSAQIVALTGLRIGAGKGGFDVTTTDLPVLRDSNGHPLIPGASLKGVIRSGVESVLRAVGEKEHKRWACDRFLEPCVEDTERMGTRSQKPRDRILESRKSLEKLCLVCRTFGAPGYGSHAVFRDAPAFEKYRVERRDGVSIDRDLGRVSGQRKYDFEVVSAGSKFEFNLTLDSMETWQQGLIAMGLDMLQEGHIRIGGATSRGLGLVHLSGLGVKELTLDNVLDGTPAQELTWENFRERAFGAWKDFRVNFGKENH